MTAASRGRWAAVDLLEAQVLEAYTSALMGLSKDVPTSSTEFFEAGGDSLAAAELLAAIARTTRLPVSFEDIIHRPTVAEFASALRQRAIERGNQLEDVSNTNYAGEPDRTLMVLFPHNADCALLRMLYPAAAARNVQLIAHVPQSPKGVTLERHPYQEVVARLAEELRAFRSAGGNAVAYSATAALASAVWQSYPEDGGFLHLLDPGNDIDSLNVDELAMACDLSLHHDGTPGDVRPPLKVVRDSLEDDLVGVLRLEEAMGARLTAEQRASLVATIMQFACNVSSSTWLTVGARATGVSSLFASETWHKKATRIRPLRHVSRTLLHGDHHTCFEDDRLVSTIFHSHAISHNAGPRSAGSGPGPER